MATGPETRVGAGGTYMPPREVDSLLDADGYEPESLPPIILDEQFITRADDLSDMILDDLPGAAADILSETIFERKRFGAGVDMTSENTTSARGPVSFLVSLERCGETILLDPVIDPA